jgi:hypothetical protein
MPRVNLEILRGPYQPALAVGHHIEACRLLTDVSMRAPAGWTAFRPGVVDTGAPLSLFPRRIWSAAAVRPLATTRLGGIIRRAECTVEATLAIVDFVIWDPFNQIGPIEAHALLADSDDVSTLIGMRGVLTTLILHADVVTNEAYLATRT